MKLILFTERADKVLPGVMHDGLHAKWENFLSHELWMNNHLKPAGAD